MGGDGGAGGNSVVVNTFGDGGGGGAGGYGAVVSGMGFRVVEDGQIISGGQGGRGGNGAGSGSRGDGGGGGDGGIGIWLGGGTLNNDGTITGGEGGARGSGYASSLTPPGRGGAGIAAGPDVTIVNSGSISGGIGGDGVTLANAITFTGGENRLELHDGFTITGNVVANGTSDTLALGGGDDGTFDVSTLGGQYQGFDGFEKTGAGTWTLASDTSEVTLWTLAGGTLSVSSDGQLGDANGELTFDGGTLATTASFNSARSVALNGNGVFDVADATALGLSGPVTGTGNLTKLGAGTLTLTGGSSMGRLYIGRGGGAPSQPLLDGGTVRLRDGATLEGTYLHLGGPQTRGVLDLAGEGTRAAFSVNALIGDVNSEAELRVSGGAVLENGIGRLGRSTGSQAVATVSGSGSLWRNLGELSVGGSGQAGQGSLRIEAGGRVESGLSRIGHGSGGEGEVVVTGAGSTWETQGRLELGYSGVGTLLIDDGATVTSHVQGSGITGMLGRPLSADSRGNTVTIRNGGAWINHGFVVVGGNVAGTGAEDTLTLSSSGRLQTGAGGGTTDRNALRLATMAGSRGTLNIGAAAGEQAEAAGVLDSARVEFGDGTAQLHFNHDDDEYRFETDLASTGPGEHAIHHHAGTTLLTGDGGGFAGATTVAGGMLRVDGVLGGTLSVEGGGALGGSGMVGTTTIGAGGALAPGGSIGTLTVDGDLLLSSGSILDFELGSAGDAPAAGTSDRVDVTGDLVLNGTLHLSQSGDSGDGSPGFGYYRLMTYGGDLSGDGLMVGDTPGLSEPGLYDILAGRGNVDLFIAAYGDDALQHWQGGDGTWNATGARWLNQGGDAAVAWAGNHAVFRNEGGFAGGTITVEGTQAFAGLQFVDEGYRLEGGGILQTHADGSEIRVLADSAGIATGITGAGGIIKTEAGTLVLSGDNSYAGGTVLAQGAIEVASDASLGHAEGSLTFEGGTLRVTGTDFATTGRAIAWGGGGFDIDEQGHVFTLGQDLAGDGDLLKTGAGTLVLAGANAYGNTLVGAGTLVGDAASLSGNVGNAGTLVFDQEEDADFTGDIGGFGGSAGSLVKQGAGELTLTGTSTLDWAVQAGGLVSAGNRFGGDLAIGQGARFTFDQADAGGYAGTLSGTGELHVTGGGTLTLDGDGAGFSGLGTVADATLVVNGLLGGTLDLLDGGTLGGTGTVGTTTVGDGGTLAPGASIGTLNVDGDLIFAAGSAYAVEVDPGSGDSDLVTVTGTAFLEGGSVLHVGSDGDYQADSTYTILTADGGIDGTFDAATSGFAFLDAALGYASDAVTLSLARNDIAFPEIVFPDAALTRNQRAVAAGAEGLGAGHAVYDAIVVLPDDEAAVRGAFDGLSGEIHASSRGALLVDARFLREGIDRRLGGGTLAGALRDGGGATLWLDGGGRQGRNDADGNAAAGRSHGDGLMLGADLALGERVRLGVVAGTNRLVQRVDARAARAEIDGTHLGVYARGDWNALSLHGGAGFTGYDLDVRREVRVGALENAPTARHDANATTVFAEGGWTFTTGAGDYTPYLALAHVRLETDAVQEDGGDAALAVAASRDELMTATLGLRGEWRLDETAHLRAGLGWQHAWGELKADSRATFAGGEAFTVYGLPLARNSAVFDLNLDLATSARSHLGLGLHGRSGDGQRGYGAHLTWRLGF